MTTLAIARKGNTVALGADTLIKDGYNNVPQELLINSSKLMRFGEHVFALTGSASAPMALQAHMESLGEAPQLDSEMQVHLFLLQLQKVMQEHYFFSPATDEHSGFKESGVTGVLANPSGIYALMGLRSVMEPSTYYSLGSGYRFALGAMHAVYEHIDSPTLIVERGLQAAALHNEDTGAPLEVIEIELDPKRARRANTHGIVSHEAAGMRGVLAPTYPQHSLRAVLDSNPEG